MRVLLALLLALAACQAQAASLRTNTTLHGQYVYLKDLFDDAGRYADRLLGPGPAPGDRIVVEAPQLNAIARQYDVEWRSISSGDRAILEWPGKPLPPDGVVKAVRAAFAAAGDTSDYDIELPEFSPPTVPADTTATLVVTQLQQDRSNNNGRFEALLTVTADGMKPMYLRIGGRADSMIDAPVTAVAIPQDAVIRAEDLRMARVARTLSDHDIARTPGQAVGLQPRRPIAAGQPLNLSDLMRPEMVRKGELVHVALITDGLAVTGQVLAVDGGSDGEVIRMQNTNSHLYLFGRVVGPGQVSVTPDAPAALQTLPVRFDHRPGQR
jgi:flagella basal body P-ring formation protein FlgA